MDLLTNPIRTHDWGSTTAIPELLGLPPDGQCQAELWIGAHERAPSSVVRGDRRVRLDEVIAADPLGEVGIQPPRLSFTAKILSVDEPLSLQVHPGADQATRAYAWEERAGLARDSGHRNYPDAGAKPELILALSEYSLLCGLYTTAERSDGATRVNLSQGQAVFVPARAQFVEACGAGTLLCVTTGGCRPAEHDAKDGPT